RAHPIAELLHAAPPAVPPGGPARLWLCQGLQGCTAHLAGTPQRLPAASGIAQGPGVGDGYPQPDDRVRPYDVELVLHGRNAGADPADQGRQAQLRRSQIGAPELAATTQAPGRTDPPHAVFRAEKDWSR